MRFGTQGSMNNYNKGTSLSLAATRVKDIQELRKEGKTVKEIADLLGMKPTNVSKLMKHNYLK